MNTERNKVITGTQVNNLANDTLAINLEETVGDGIYIRKLRFIGTSAFIQINQADVGSANPETIFMQSQNNPRLTGAQDILDTSVWLTKGYLDILTNQETGVTWSLYIEYDIYPSGYLTSITTSAVGNVATSPEVVLSGATSPKIIKTLIAAPTNATTVINNVVFSIREIATPANTSSIHNASNLDGESYNFIDYQDTDYLTDGYELVLSGDSGDIDYFITYANIPEGL